MAERAVDPRRPDGAGLWHRLARWPYLAVNVAVDGWRFARHSGAVRAQGSRQHQAAHVTIAYHALEKGLCLQPRKPWFGERTVTELTARLEDYVERHGADETVTVALGALRGYLAAQTTPPPSWATSLPERVRRLGDAADRPANEPIEPAEATTAAAIAAVAFADPEAFFAHRHSIRNFADESVPWSVVERAVALAQYSPRVCNREAARVRAYARGSQADAVLALQSGNRGFGDQAAWVLVLTMDLRQYVLIGERNQGWIDGGIFAMNLVTAFHALGVGTCCLNWSQPVHADRALRRRTDIADHEVVTMMMAVGYPAATLDVARSARRPLDQVLNRPLA